MTNYIAIKHKQQDQDFLSTVLPFREINKISKVLIYGEDEYGYQRNLDKKHYLDIKKAILKNPLATLPTSIILSVNRNDIETFITPIENFTNLVELNLDAANKVFRIVDGQHRLKGLEEAAIEKPSINEFELNVIILITDEENRAIEIDIFHDINLLAKKIKTDLTLVAKYNYQLLGKSEIKDVTEHVSVKVAYYLNEKVPNSVWYNAIIFDPNVERPLGIIGVEAFRKSIHSMVYDYLQENPYGEGKLIQYTDMCAQNIAIIINQAWDVVRKKWKYCFENGQYKNIFEMESIYCDKGFYIQKTTGTNALNMILYECIKENGFSSASIDQFENILAVSQVTTDDWQVGGVFAGLTSGSGFLKAKKYILNEIKIPRL